MNKKVNILLATYNGEKHLIKQLDSLMEQTYDNMDIYIRDDGSTDNTVALINKYIDEHKSSKRIILLPDDGRNLRCPGSFYEIARKCEDADYYGFCDQDDIWYPNKVQWAVERLEKENSSQMLVYYSACDYIYEDGTFIRKSPDQNDSLTLKDVLYYTPGSGFTMMFNETARRKMILSCDPGEELHDRWILRGAACFGKAIYDSRSTAAHVRHEDAVTANDSGFFQLLRQFVFCELFGDDTKKDKKALQYFYRTFGNELKGEEKAILHLFATDKKSFTIWGRKLFFKYRLRRRLAGEIAIRIQLFLGII